LTVGGIVTAAKKVRTRSGAHIMFATLDDLDGSVELFVRDVGSEAAGAIEVDRVILVRGRVDHKEPGQTSVVVAEADAFEPTAERSIPQAVVIRLDATRLDAGLLSDLKAVFEVFPGDSEVLLEMDTREGVRRLRFGSGYRIDPSPALHAELDQLLGTHAIAA
jgi:DNA polymerase-3 subunit alpha